VAHGQRFDLTRVRLRFYRSIAACDVHLGPLTMLVGRNGSGKSNFLDALRLTAQALAENLDNALRERGGVAEVRRRFKGHPTHFAISTARCQPYLYCFDALPQISSANTH
jgi:predicted ATPase